MDRRAKDLGPDDIGRTIEARGEVPSLRGRMTVAGTLVGYSCSADKASTPTVALAIDCGYSVVNVNVSGINTVHVGRVVR